MIGDEQTSMPLGASVSRGAVAQVVVLGILIVWVYRPAIDLMVHQWQEDGNWSHGWLVPVFSLYFLLMHRQDLFAARRRASYVGAVVLLASLALYYGSYLAGPVYPQQFSLVPCVLGLVLLIGGWGILRVTWFPIVYLLFAIPLPHTVYVALTLPLRKIASMVAGAALRLFPEVYTQVQGVVVDYEYQERVGSLNVEQACSGMRLMMAFCALGVAMAYLGDRPLWQRVVMVLCCVPIAVLCNTIRVFSTGVIHVYGFDDWAQGTAHELLGLSMLLIALGLFSLLSNVLRRIVVEDVEDEVGAE